MAQNTPPPKKLDALNLSAFLTLTAAGSGALLEIRYVYQRWIALVLLIAIGVGMWLASDLTTQKSAGRLRLHGYLLVQTLLVTLLLLLASNSAFGPMIFFVFSVTAMMLFPFRVAALWIAVFVIISGAHFIRFLGWIDGLQTLFPFVGGYFFFGAFANALYRASLANREKEKLFEALSNAHQELQVYASQVEKLTISQERNRLAREVHDTIGHHLTVASVQLEGASRLMTSDPQKAAKMIDIVREQVSVALKEIRQTVSRLREPLEAELPLPNSLKQLAASFEQGTAIKVDLNFPNEWSPLPPAHQLTLYRTAQEALTNVQRHAHADHVWITLSRNNEKVILTVSDNGVGLSRAEEGKVAQSGFGLLGLQERAVQLGGSLYLVDGSQTPDGENQGSTCGVTLILEIPYQQEERDA